MDYQSCNSCGGCGGYETGESQSDHYNMGSPMNPRDYIGKNEEDL